MFVLANINYILFCTLIKTKQLYKRSNCKQGAAIFRADLSYNCNSIEAACVFLNGMAENLPQASKPLEALVDSFLSASNSLCTFFSSVKTLTLVIAFGQITYVGASPTYPSSASTRSPFSSMFFRAVQKY